jgi:hypothetical protein
MKAFLDKRKPAFGGNELERHMTFVHTTRSRAIALVAYLGVAACMPVASNGLPRPNDAASAAILAASNAAASVVNRKLTRECYGVCTLGTACNHETGMCDRIPCSCPADQVCENVGTEVVCRQPHIRQEGAMDAGADDALDGAERHEVGPPRAP